jgi:hypothetical protein
MAAIISKNGGYQLYKWWLLAIKMAAIILKMAAISFTNGGY